MSTKELEAITLSESKRLVQLEKVIETGVNEVGEALKEIRDSRLYRADHSTFETYCFFKWGFSRQRGYQLIDSWEVKSDLPKNVKKLLTNPSQATELKKAPPAKRAEIVKKAAASGKVTAASIKKASTPAPKKVEPEIEKDKLDYPIPQGVMEHWLRAYEVQELLTSISFVRGKLKKFEDAEDLLFARADFSSLKASLGQAYADIEHCKPFTVCPYCSGKLPEKCAECNKTGFISEFQWKTSVPEEIKKLREKK